MRLFVRLVGWIFLFSFSTTQYKIGLSVLNAIITFFSHVVTTAERTDS